MPFVNLVIFVLPLCFPTWVLHAGSKTNIKRNYVFFFLWLLYYKFIFSFLSLHCQKWKYCWNYSIKTLLRDKCQIINWKRAKYNENEKKDFLQCDTKASYLNIQLSFAHIFKTLRIFFYFILKITTGKHFATRKLFSHSSAERSNFSFLIYQRRNIYLKGNFYCTCMTFLD